MHVRVLPRAARLVALLIVLPVAAVAVGAALATTGEGTAGTILNRGSNTDQVKIQTDQIKFKTTGPTDILVVTQTWQPGGHSGWHSHQGPRPVHAQVRDDLGLRRQLP
jgi:hypothetical protein